jgi:hypothetical protein
MSVGSEGIGTRLIRNVAARHAEGGLRLPRLFAPVVSQSHDFSEPIDAHHQLGRACYSRATAGFGRRFLCIV